jgi:hypothetical protein
MCCKPSSVKWSIELCQDYHKDSIQVTELWSKHCCYEKLLVYEYSLYEKNLFWPSWKRVRHPKTTTILGASLLTNPRYSPISLQPPTSTTLLWIEDEAPDKPPSFKAPLSLTNPRCSPTSLSYSTPDLRLISPRPATYSRSPFLFNLNVGELCTQSDVRFVLYNSIPY